MISLVNLLSRFRRLDWRRRSPTKEGCMWFIRLSHVAVVLAIVLVAGWLTTSGMHVLASPERGGHASAVAAPLEPSDTPEPIVGEQVDEWAVGGGFVYWATNCFDEFEDSGFLRRRPTRANITTTLQV